MSVIVTVAVSVMSTKDEYPALRFVRPTTKLSLLSTTKSSVIGTVTLRLWLFPVALNVTVGEAGLL